MARNPKKPVINELIDDTAGVILAGDWVYDGVDGLDFSEREDQCTECFGHGTIDHDDSGDEDLCHVCGGVGYLTYIP